MDGAQQKPGVRSLLSDRDVRYFLIGTTTSVIGDNALWLTLSIWVKVLTGSTSAAGLSIFMLTLGLMTAPLTGIVVDRVRRLRLMIIVNLLAGLLVGTLLFVQSQAQLWLIFLVMFGYGAAYAVTNSAQVALVQTLVPEPLIGQANSITQTIAQGARLVTPLVCAGVFAATGAKPIVIADCVSFGVAVACLLQVRTVEARLMASGEHWLRHLTAGARHLARDRLLRASSIAGVLALTTFGLSETVIYAVVDKGLHRSPPFLGVLSSAQGLGAILGGLTAARMLRCLDERRLLVIGLTLTASSFFLQAIPNLVVVVAGMGLLGVSLSYLVVSTMTMLQRRTPANLMGRVGSAFNFVTTVPQTAAIAAGAALIVLTPYQVLLLIMGLLDLIGAAYLLAQRSSGLAEVEVRPVAASVDGPGADER